MPEAVVTPEWIAQRGDLYRELTAEVNRRVQEQTTLTVEQALQSLPEGWRLLWHVARYFHEMTVGGTDGFFRNSLRDDTTGRRVEAAYIALNRLGLLQFATLLARGAGVELHLCSKSSEAIFRGLMGDAGLQAPPRKRTLPAPEQHAQALTLLDRQFHEHGPIWIPHIERFVRSSPRLFVES